MSYVVSREPGEKVSLFLSTNCTPIKNPSSAWLHFSTCNIPDIMISLTTFGVLQHAAKVSEGENCLRGAPPPPPHGRKLADTKLCPSKKEQGFLRLDRYTSFIDCAEVSYYCQNTTNTTRECSWTMIKSKSIRPYWVWIFSISDCQWIDYNIWKNSKYLSTDCAVIVQNYADRSSDVWTEWSALITTTWNANAVDWIRHSENKKCYLTYAI